MIFRRALIRLTLAYTIVQLVIFGIFALGVYSFVTGAFDFDAAADEGESSLDVEQSFENLRVGLIAGYGILLVVLPVSSFVMARGALAPIKRSYDMQQHFVDSASHEFRTPLSVIHGELELALSRSRTPAQYRDAIEHALVATQSLSTLTSDLLLLTRDSSHDLEATFTSVSLPALAREIVASHPEASRLIVEADREVVVTGSTELLKRAVANLIDNAVKFSEASTSVILRVSSSGNLAHIAVTDRGSGMTSEDTSHAFDRFWRAEGSRTTPGFGLGLPLVQQIVVAHGGQVALDSTVNDGTTVTVSLPSRQG